MKVIVLRQRVLYLYECSRGPIDQVVLSQLSPKIKITILLRIPPFFRILLKR